MKTRLPLLILALSACTPQWDMQGVDPKDYYAAHPIKNKLEKQNASVSLTFEPHENRLAPDALAALRSDLRDISPPAAESLTIVTSEEAMHNETRKHYIATFLRSLGYMKTPVTFQASPELARDAMRIDITYLAVIAPDCPDWRRSPVTTYSNTTQGNFGCAPEVNLGVMVADPHDLVRGNAVSKMDSERDSLAIDSYRSGAAPAAAPAAAGGASASAPASGSGATPTPQ